MRKISWFRTKSLAQRMLLLIIGGSFALCTVVVFLLLTTTTTYAATPTNGQVRSTPANFCEAGPHQINITKAQNFFFLPLGSDPGLSSPEIQITVDPCTISYLHNHGDINTLTVHSDGTWPAWLIPSLKQVIAWHINDLWKTSLTCAHQEHGLFFIMANPNLSFGLEALGQDIAQSFSPQFTCQ